MEDIELLTEKEVAPMIRKSVYWLRGSRHYGYGIPYRKIRGSVVYEKKVVQEWIKSHVVQISIKE